MVIWCGPPNKGKTTIARKVLKMGSCQKMLVNQVSMELYHQQNEKYGLLTIYDDNDSSRKVIIALFGFANLIMHSISLLLQEYFCTGAPNSCQELRQSFLRYKDWWRTKIWRWTNCDDHQQSWGFQRPKGKESISCEALYFPIQQFLAALGENHLLGSTVLIVQPSRRWNGQNLGQTRDEPDH